MIASNFFTGMSIASLGFLVAEVFVGGPYFLITSVFMALLISTALAIIAFAIEKSMKEEVIMEEPA